MKAILKSLYQNSKNKEIKTLILNTFKDHLSRFYVAKNINAPEYILEKLSKDESWIVRASIIYNRSTPIHILERLSNDKDWNVRIVIARNPSTPIHILEKLSNDKNFDIRASVAGNKNWINRQG